MSRLDSFIRRLEAQRACLELAADLIAGLDGEVLELGLGNGRTYDHLRKLFPHRKIYVCERAVAAHPDCVPPSALLLLGDMRETLPAVRARLADRVVLAHLDPKRASMVLDNLSEEHKVVSIQRLAEMRQFSPEMAQTVAMALHKRMEKMGSSGRKSYSGFKAVAELLNRLDQGESRGILEEIEQSEPKVAIGIRELMFVFEDLVTVPAESIREFVSAADKKVLAMALKGGKENVKAHLFKAMSSRAVEMLKEDMEVLGPVRMRDVGLAQQELLTLARQLESEGKMILKMEVDDDLAV